jgi:glycosyltransferase involved in cell wall biosynthesis
MNRQHQMIRIGVNALYLIPGGVGGTEIYLRNLLRALAEIDAENQYVVFTNRETGADLVPDRPNFAPAPQPVRASFRPARILWEQLVLPFAIRKHRIQCSAESGIYRAAAVRLPDGHGISRSAAQAASGILSLVRSAVLEFLGMGLGAALARIDRGVPSHRRRSRTLLRPLGAGDPSRRGARVLRIAQRREPRDYLLCVSTTHPHKNLQRLLRVHAQMKNAPRLMLTGVRGFAAREIESLAGSVELTGWIPREQLYELYRGALGFIYPSTFEGFGMPVLEAMAAGVPVACSDIPPLREIARSTVHFFDPASDREIRDALLLLASGKTLHRRPRNAAPLEFSWEKTARATLDYLSKCSS